MRDAAGGLIWCNRAYARALGTSQATVVAEQRELPSKPAKKGAQAPRPAGRTLAQAARENKSAEETYAHIIIEGQRRLYAISERPLHGSAGMTGDAAGDGITLGRAIDRTREEELELEHRRYTAANNELLEQLGTAIGIYDADQKLEFFNSAFAQLWKLEDSYLNGQPKLGDLMEKLRENRLLPEQADFRRFKQTWINMFTGLLGPHEDMMYLPDSTALRMLVVPHPMGGLMMTFEDVSSRLALESSYNTLVAVQKETLDNLTEGVAVFGGDGRIKLWNPAFTRLWSLHPEDVQGEPHISRLVERMKPAFDPIEWPAIRVQLMAQCLDRRVEKGRLDGLGGLAIAYSTVPLPDGGVLVTHVDITDTARVENALREKNAALEAAERLKTDFLANVSYQLRTPLSAIVGFADILANEYFGPLNQRQKEYTGGMREAGEQLVALINDILDLSTIEAGYMALDKTDVALKPMLTALQDLTAAWATNQNVQVKIDCPEDIGAVLADERRLKQVLLNLIRNAITFTPPGGVITLRARRLKTESGGQIALAVEDTGLGMNAEDLARVFEPFERAHPGIAGGHAPGHQRGAGLGLTLVRNIVQLHEGAVTLDSAPGKGTQVKITLPAAD
jgi:signal transduction histidine kinase